MQNIYHVHITGLVGMVFSKRERGGGGWWGFGFQNLFSFLVLKRI